MLRRNKITLLHQLAFFGMLTVLTMLHKNASAFEGDEFWLEGYALSGFDGEISDAVKTDSGDIYIVGEFEHFNGIPISGVARFTDGQWASVGEDFGNARAIAEGPDGTIYAAGFSSLRSWNGSSWKQVFPNDSYGIFGEIDNIAVLPSGEIILSGSNFSLETINADSSSTFRSIGNLIQSDEVSFSPVGSGLQSSSRLRVNDMVVSSTGLLYVAGEFDSAGGLANTDGFAMWNGTTWNALGSGLDHPAPNSFSASARSLAIDSNDQVYVAGFFQIAGGEQALSSVALWDGIENWTAVPLPPDVFSNFTQVMAVDNSDNLYTYGSLLGNFFFDPTKSQLGFWNGSDWQIHESPLAGTAQTLITHDEGVITGGYLSAAGIGNIAFWDGSSWSGYSTSLNFNGVQGDIVDSATSPDGSLFIAGDLLVNGQQGALAVWENNQWMMVDGFDFSGVRAIDIAPNGDLYLGGQFTIRPNGVRITDVMRWDGISQHPLIDCSISSQCFQRRTINDLALDAAGLLYVVGDFDSIGGASASNIAAWDGSTWSSVGSSIGTNFQRVFVASDSSVYVSGNIDSVNGHPADDVARWDGTTWDALAGGLPSAFVQSFTETMNGDIYAGGSDANNRTRQFSKWDGVAWTSIPVPDAFSFNANITTLHTLPNNDIVVAGGFGPFPHDASAGFNSIALYDGSEWAPLGSGIDGGVNTLSLEPNGHLFVGGAFTTAGDLAAKNVARWDTGQSLTTYECNGIAATIVGTSANDKITGTPNADVIVGLGGDDEISGLAGNDIICGGPGIDTIDGGIGDDWIDGEAGNDQLKGGPDNDTIYGGPDDDNIRGSRGNDQIEGGEGNDEIDAGIGDDFAKGGPGDDIIEGNLGDDVLRGSKGNDSLDGGEGVDTIDGGVGDDFVKGGPDNDVLAGGDGIDNLRGSRGNDSLDGGPGNDLLFGGTGDDFVKGGLGDDTLDGGEDNDVLRGSRGNDSLDGGLGDDSLNGGEGTDECRLDVTDSELYMLCEI